MTVDLVAFDFDRLCWPGIPSVPYEVGHLTPGQQLTVFVGVCGYVAEEGDRDTETTGTIAFTSSGRGKAEVTWSFIPVEGL